MPHFHFDGIRETLRPRSATPIAFGACNLISRLFAGHGRWWGEKEERGGEGEGGRGMRWGEEDEGGFLGSLPQFLFPEGDGTRC